MTNRDCTASQPFAETNPACYTITFDFIADNSETVVLLGFPTNIGHLENKGPLRMLLVPHARWQTVADIASIFARCMEIFLDSF